MRQGWRLTAPTVIPVLLLVTGPSSGAQEVALDELEITVGEMRFRARAAGPEDGPLVLLLHGFPQTSYSYRHQLRTLGSLGYRAVASDQRGYSPGARPEGVDAYAVPRLVEDVIGIADALGAKCFDLVGHDWGGAVAWVVATRVPGRVRTLTVLSTPHYGALGAALGEPESEQARRSSYFSTFSSPGAEHILLADDGARLRAIYGDLDPEVVEAYMAVLGEPEALSAALAWYAAAFGSSPSTPDAPPPPPPAPVTVPTLYVWSTDDVAFARSTAEATRRFVSGPYRFEVLEGVDHWVTERVPETITHLLVEHLVSAADSGGA